MATLSSLGLVTSMGLALFIACKLCSEVLEASQTTSFLLLLAMAFAYASFIPYGLEANAELICSLRSKAVRVAFAFIFSVMLSRSIMLATADVDGLPGHLSGCIQLALLFFMTAVQVIWPFFEDFVKKRTLESNFYNDRLHTGIGLKINLIPRLKKDFITGGLSIGRMVPRHKSHPSIYP